MIAFLWAVAILAGTLGLLFQSLPVAVSVFISAGIIVLTAGRRTHTQYLRYIIIFGIQVCFVILLYHGYIDKYGLPYYNGGSDDIAFERVSNALVEQGKYFLHQISSADIYDVTNNQTAYLNSRGFLVYLIWLRGIFEPMGGYHTMAPRLINMGLLLSTAIITEKVYVHLHRREDSSVPAWLVSVVALFPNAMYISAHVFRDILSLWLIMLSFYLLLRILNSGENIFTRITRMAAVLGIALAAQSIRGENVYYIAAAALACILGALKRNGQSFWNSRKAIGRILVFGLLILAFTYQTGLLDRILLKVTGYSAYRQGFDMGLSSFIFSQPLLPFGVLLRIAYALVNPLPIHLLTPAGMFSDISIFVNILLSLGTVVQILMYPYLFRDKRFDEPWWLFWICLLSIAAVTFTFRHFVLIYPFLAIIIARNYAATGKETRLILAGSMVVLMLILAGSYFLLKQTSF